MAEDTPPAVSPDVAPVAPVAPVVPAVESPAPAAPEPSAPADSVAPVAEPAPEVLPEAPAPESPAAEPAAPPTEGEKPEGEAPPAQAEAAPPKYTDFKMPDGMTIAPEQNSAYANILGKYNLSQEAGQELMDFGGSIVKKTQEQMVQRQQDVFADTRRGFVSDAQKSFGNKFDTVVNDAKFAITELVPSKTARADLWNVLSFTGAGDHKAVIGAFAAAGKILREREAPGPSVPQNGAKPGSPADRRYGEVQK